MIYFSDKDVEYYRAHMMLVTMHVNKIVDELVKESIEVNGLVAL